MLAGVILICLVGVSLGLLGAGGAAIALPILVYVVRLEAHQAVTVSILIVGLVSGFGAVLHHRQRNVRWAVAAAFAPFGVAGAWLGARASYLLPARVLLMIFSGLLIIIALRILTEQPTAAEGSQRPWALGLSGFGIGLLTGFLGVGGGFVIVPALHWFAGLGMREAVGTSLVIIAVNSAAAFGQHWGQQRDLPAGAVGALLASAAAGMAAGIRLGRRVDPARLRRWFAYVLLAVALFMMIRSILGR